MNPTSRRTFLTTAAALPFASNLLAAPKTQPLLPRIFVSAHRGGAGFPDNTPELIESSVKLGVSAAELDVTVSTDNRLFLFHPYHWSPDKPGEIVDIGPTWTKKDLDKWGRITLRGLPWSKVKEVRYSVRVGDKVFADQRIHLAEEVFGPFKGKINFHIDPEGLMEPFYEAFDRHQNHSQILMQFGAYRYLANFRARQPKMIAQCKAPGVSYYPDGKLDTAGQMKALRQAIKESKAIGANMLVMQDITAEKLELCHRAKLAAVPRASFVNVTGGDAFLKEGIDALFGDAPKKMLKSIEAILGAKYLPQRGESVADLFSVTT
ncbi:MAG: hypothetical protein CMO80_07500 [Verrucomicrobiales bacterium]|nr:hypothetical protein [Verrucomicrobiales bacterium]|tara:strand:- start:3021 stop:3983 length:963 start_codon:yes stop_codon:yes gene_type:complete